MKKIFYAILFAAALVTSCKKEKKDDGSGPSKTGSTLDLVRDSVFLYAKEAYYWYDALPSYASFNPRSITGSSDLDALTKEVDRLSQYKINPATGKAYEYYSTAGEAKYSFIDEGEVATQLGGTNINFGFSPLYNDVNDLRIKYVYAGSPAAVAGLKRGYQIVGINGNTNLAYDGASGTHTQFVVNACFNATHISMTVQKPDLSTFVATFDATAYTVDPVLTYKAIDAGSGKKIGYIVFNTFTSTANAAPKLDAAFNYFQAQGITELVVDLRYNGGGFTSTAEYLDNLIVPSAKNNTTMYSYYFNDILAGGKEKLLANQVRRDESTGQLYNYAQLDYTVAGNTMKFAKKGTLEISRVFFIVSGSTASAAELTINNLRPHLNVQFIGTTTYGKPVGFFDIDINKYQLYMPQFETKNSAGQGGYYSGMTPGSSDYPGVNDFDDPTKDFGDTTEVLLHHAVNYVKKGTFSFAKTQIQGLAAKQKTFSLDQANQAAIVLDGNKFNGMVFNGKLKKK